MSTCRGQNLSVKGGSLLRWLRRKAHSDKTAKGKIMEEYDDWAEAEALITYCNVCDGVGHDGGEFGELCLANGRSWFEPSDPRDLYDGEDCF